MFVWFSCNGSRRNIGLNDSPLCLAAGGAAGGLDTSTLSTLGPSNEFVRVDIALQIRLIYRLSISDDFYKKRLEMDSIWSDLVYWRLFWMAKSTNRLRMMTLSRRISSQFHCGLFAHVAWLPLVICLFVQRDQMAECVGWSRDQVLPVGLCIFWTARARGLCWTILIDWFDSFFLRNVVEEEESDDLWSWASKAFRFNFVMDGSVRVCSA